MKIPEGIGINTGSWGRHDAVFFLFEEVSGGVLRSTKEYSLAYVPELDEWHGDVIAYGEWVDIDKEEIADLRSRYCLDRLSSANWRRFAQQPQTD